MQSSTKLVGAAEAASMIGVNRYTVTRWVASGRLKAAHQLPGRTGALLFDAAEVERVAEEYLAERTPQQVRPDPEAVAAS